MTYKGLPIFNLTVDEDEFGVNKISLVDFPAVESTFLVFNENEEPKEYKFSIKDEEKRIVSGIAMRADFPIYREDSDGKGYYVIFSKETIEKVACKFAKNNYGFNISVQHSQDVADCYVVESFIINKERGVCPVEFKDVEDGSWYCSIKIDNDQVWNEIKNSGEINGFSVEILARAEEYSKTENSDVEPQLERTSQSWLDNLLAGKILTK